VDILSIRIRLRPGDLDRSRRFYRDILSLAVSRESGPPDDPWMVFFPGQRLLEVCGHAAGPPGHSVMLWIQARGRPRRACPAGRSRRPVTREPAVEPRGLIEMQIEDPTASGSSWSRCPAGHPLRRDPRSASPHG